MPEAEVNGIRLYYEEHGEGPPIACIHGAGSSAVMWGDAVEKLAGLGRVIAYDRRGCGRSERPEPYEQTTVTEQADERTWRTLPAAISVGRVTVPTGDHRLGVEVGTARHEFAVNVQGPYALVCIRILGSQAYLVSPAGAAGRDGSEKRAGDMQVGLR